MLEAMSEFFDRRLSEYDTHMRNDIVGAAEFYPYTASCLPRHPNASVLDLGCGTGLELEEYFLLNPSARIVGIDLAPGMLNSCKAKFQGKSLSLIQGSYFDVPFGNGAFDAAVSVESLHHFTKDKKIPLYQKLKHALRRDGYFILTDYFASSDEEELHHRKEITRLKEAEGICDGGFYHYDTPLTVAHEVEALLEAGFSSVEELRHWGATYTLRAIL